MKLKRLFLAGAVFATQAVPLLAQTAGGDGWINLVNGKNFDGWIQRGGQAKYEIVDGMVVGSCVPNTPNSFLCTTRTYGDFILELEFKVDPTLNSGVQIRSHEVGAPYSLTHNGKTIKVGTNRVHGYQVEIDPSSRAWSGGIYDEGRRGWLNDLKNNPAAGKAFKQNDWNKFRIEARGDSLKTWINGVAAADLKDDLTPRGFISLQVHGVGKSEDKRQVAWRNVRLQDLDASKRIALFDGTSLDAWETGDGKPVTKGWVIENGALARLDSGGQIYTKKEYGDFELEFDWKISAGGNSGVKYRVTKYGKEMLGVEYQVLDDDKHPDGQKREGRRKSGALYDILATNVSKRLKPVGEYNHSLIIAKGTKFEHWLNGTKVAEADTTSETWQKEIAASKFARTEGFAQNSKGKIMLQDHGDKVWYKNITIRPL
ncbi:MAG: DUF1080 domain-containing protein [Verrucomicrobiota bacterium]